VSQLKGSKELRARLKAIRQTFKPVGKGWAEDTRDYARAHVPQRSGHLKNSIRVRNASQRKATVVGNFTANFVDAGTKAHDEKPKRAKVLRFQEGGRIVFAKKVHHPRTQRRPFKRAAALEGLRKNPMAAELIKLWNEAAP
jgi:hypothetical protein